MKPNDLIEVVCPDCGKKRKIKWSAYKHKDIGPLYVQRDRMCAQKAKKLSAETKEKISKSLKGMPKSDEMKEKLAQYRLEHPTENLVPGAGGGWNKDMELGPRTEETKKKISETIKETLKNKKEFGNEPS